MERKCLYSVSSCERKFINFEKRTKKEDWMKKEDTEIRETKDRVQRNYAVRGIWWNKSYRTENLQDSNSPENDKLHLGLRRRTFSFDTSSGRSERIKMNLWRDAKFRRSFVLKNGEVRSLKRKQMKTMVKETSYYDHDEKEQESQQSRVCLRHDNHREHENENDSNTWMRKEIVSEWWEREDQWRWEEGPADWVNKGSQRKAKVIPTICRWACPQDNTDSGRRARSGYRRGSWSRSKRLQSSATSEEEVISAWDAGNCVLLLASKDMSGADRRDVLQIHDTGD